MNFLSIGLGPVDSTYKLSQSKVSGVLRLGPPKDGAVSVELDGKVMRAVVLGDGKSFAFQSGSSSYLLSLSDAQVSGYLTSVFVSQRNDEFDGYVVKLKCKK
jgi:hypothetical protein